MMTVAELLRTLDTQVPPGQAADWDPVGLQVGDPTAEVSAVLVALDLTPAVVAEARELGAQAIVTHHPLLFKATQKVSAADPIGALVWTLAQAGIAHLAVHTNLDAAWGGVSFALASQLGLQDVGLLAPLDESLVRVTTYVPHEAAEAVREAMAAAGAGDIGMYRGCSFSTAGEGRFTPGPGATPAMGSVGHPSTVQEMRIEAIAPRWTAATVRQAIAAAHPYETPATEVVPVIGRSTRQGFGAVGTLSEPEPLLAFLARVREALGADALHYVGNSDRMVERVAVCGGSGMSFMGAALASGADAFVTADITYHRYFEALAPDGTPRLALIDAGHYETERCAERLLGDLLRSHAPDLTIYRTALRTSPVRAFAG